MEPRGERQEESLLEFERAKSQRKAGIISAISKGLGILIVILSIVLSIFLASELYAESDSNILMVQVIAVSVVFSAFGFGAVNYGNRRNSQTIIRVGVIGAIIATVVAVGFIVSET